MTNTNGKTNGKSNGGKPDTKAAAGKSKPMGKSEGAGKPKAAGAAAPRVEVTRVPLGATRRVQVPAYLAAELAAAPTVVVVSDYRPTVEFVYPDFAALFPVSPGRVSDDGAAGAAAAVCGSVATADGDEFDDEFDDMGSCYTAAAAAHLYIGAEILFDVICEVTGLYQWDLRSEELFDADMFDVCGLDGVLPDPVVDWLGAFEPLEAATWVALLLAEVQMHAMELAVGRFPSPHTTGSEMALHLIFEQARDWFIDAPGSDPELGPGLDGFDRVDDDLFVLSDLLFEDTDVLWLDSPDLAEMAMGCELLHPANWFEPFRDGVNPWVAPRT